MSSMEEISAGGTIVAFVIRAQSPEETTFITPPDANLQVGFVVKAAGMDIPRHDHKKIERRIAGTCEVLVLQRGRCDVDFFDDGRNFIGTRKLASGDILVLLRGGHGFRILEDTTFLEIKQGPYPGTEEKDQF